MHIYIYVQLHIWQLLMGYKYIHIYIYIYLYISIYIYISVGGFSRTHLHVSGPWVESVSSHGDAYTYAYAYLYINIYIYIYTYLYVYSIYVYIYINEVLWGFLKRAMYRSFSEALPFRTCLKERKDMCMALPKGIHTYMISDFIWFSLILVDFPVFQWISMDYHFCRYAYAFNFFSSIFHIPDSHSFSWISIKHIYNVVELDEQSE